MSNLSAKTGGLFNLKSIAKGKERNDIINQIIELNIKSCNDQSIPYHLLGFEKLWRARLRFNNMRELKRELKLKILTSVHVNVNESKK